MTVSDPVVWPKGSVPVTVVMITLNEAHNLEQVLDNLSGWADEVIMVDSYSVDSTVDIALSRGVRVVQRKFRGFGDQWNFALSLPTTSQWTMKLDPDERISDELKKSIQEAIVNVDGSAYTMKRYIQFLGKRMPIAQEILRLWRTGRCRFSDVVVNEHPLVDGEPILLQGALDHLDSPNLDHWFSKQNKYTTLEAKRQLEGDLLSVKPSLLGDSLQRRMWIKRHFWRFPGRFIILFAYLYLVTGAWRAGKTGLYWAQLRTFVYWQWGMKYFEMGLQGGPYACIPTGAGLPDPRVPCAD